MEETSPARSARILIVEDDKILLDLMRRSLRMHFEHVVAMSDPREAEALLQSRPETVDILLADIAMPELSGPQLAQVARRFNPQLTTLFMSGFVKTADQQAMLSNSRLLWKPFTPTELIAFVRGENRGDEEHYLDAPAS